jgi:dTMP kinase
MTSENPSTVRAPFIVIEGLDGAGGTTQSRLLQSWLERQGHTVVQTNEPTDLPVGQLIRQVIQDPHSKVGDEVLAYLFAADRQNHLTQTILPALSSGTVVLSDRYYHSSLAYQSMSLDFDFVAQLNERFQAPDITIFLLLEPETSFERVQKRGLPIERFETLDRLRSIAQSYNRVIEYCQHRGEQILCLDATQSIEEIHERICAEIEPLMPRQSES